MGTSLNTSFLLTSIKPWWKSLAIEAKKPEDSATFTSEELKTTAQSVFDKTVNSDFVRNNPIVRQPLEEFLSLSNELNQPKYFGLDGDPSTLSWADIAQLTKKDGNPDNLSPADLNAVPDP